MTSEMAIQWAVLISALLIFFFLAPRARTIQDFFFGSKDSNHAPNTLVLTSGLVISWIFAKSITNAAGLGATFGLLGGIGYAGYYLSFLVAGFVLYKLRTKGKWTSIHHFLTGRYGRTATQVFSVLISIRLFNEIWSNTMVIGSFFGEGGSSGYYVAIFVFTGLTLAYVLKGGLKASLFTDVIQMFLFALFLFVILAAVLPSFSGKPLNTDFWGTWSFDSGLDFLVLAIVQSLSYPFHDPVLTDRAFITNPKTTRRSYIWAAILGMIFIVLFSLVGVSMRLSGHENELMGFAKGMGIPLFMVINLIMITSATSTLDSSFSSFSKLLVVDIFKSRKVTIKAGRLAMIALAVIGTIPVFFNAEILQATTISGTMVIGLAPVFILWNLEVPKISFFLSVGVGLLCGIAQTIHLIPKSWFWTSGKYADLLFINCIGTILSFIVFILPYLLLRWRKSQ